MTRTGLYGAARVYENYLARASQSGFQDDAPRLSVARCR